MTEPANKRVRDWLLSQGYPLEMRTAKVFQDADYRVIQSEYYSDPESDTTREIDVYAFSQEEVGQGLIRVSWVVECKSTTGKPWVLFTSNRKFSGRARVVQRAASRLGRSFLLKISGSDAAKRLRLFHVSERPAYAMTEAFTTGHDRAYEAAMAASKAAAAQAAAAESPRGDIAEIVFPLIVVSGNLFEAYLDESGELAVETIYSGTLVWRKPVVGVPFTIISVVAESHLAELLRDTREDVNRLLAFGKQAIPKLPRRGA